MQSGFNQENATLFSKMRNGVPKKKSWDVLLLYAVYIPHKGSSVKPFQSDVHTFGVTAYFRTEDTEFRRNTLFVVAG